MSSTASCVKEVTEQQSLAATTNILTSLISELCHSRRIFPAEAFVKKKFGRGKIHAFEDKGKCEGAGQVQAWINEGVADLLKRGLLRMVIFYLFEEDPTKWTEAWYFRVGKTGDLELVESNKVDGKSQPQLIGRTKEEIKELCGTLARTVGQMGLAMSELPDVYSVSMRLAYEPDPDDPSYVPNMFVDADQVGQRTIGFRRKPANMVLGTTKTPHHFLMLKLKSLTLDDENKPDEMYIENEALELDNDEMWRQSDDEDEEHDKPSAARGEGGKGGQNDDMMLLDLDAEVSRELHLACLEYLSKLGANNRVNSTQLQTQITCTPGQANHLVSKMIDTGELERVRSKIVKIPLYKRPDSLVAPPPSQSSTISCDPPAFASNPAGFTASTTRQRLYGGLPEPQRHARAPKPAQQRPDSPIDTSLPALFGGVDLNRVDEDDEEPNEPSCSQIPMPVVAERPSSSKPRVAARRPPPQPRSAKPAPPAALPTASPASITRRSRYGPRTAPSDTCRTATVSAIHKSASRRRGGSAKA